MQLYLNLPQIPLPLESVWEQLSESEQGVALEALAKLLAKAVMAETKQEKSND